MAGGKDKHDAASQRGPNLPGEASDFESFQRGTSHRQERRIVSKPISPEIFNPRIQRALRGRKFEGASAEFVSARILLFTKRNILRKIERQMREEPPRTFEPLSFDTK